MLGAPLLMAIVSVFHPLPPPFSNAGLLESFRSRMGIWMGVRLIQLPIFALLGLTLLLLTEGLRGRAATISRLAVVLFPVFAPLLTSAG
jgi:hypothetical protein